jgi:hypothetical protein
MGRSHHSVSHEERTLDSGDRHCVIQAGSDIPDRAFEVFASFANRRDVTQRIPRRFDTFGVGDHPPREIGRREARRSIGLYRLDLQTLGSGGRRRGAAQLRLTTFSSSWYRSLVTTRRLRATLSAPSRRIAARVVRGRVPLGHQFLHASVAPSGPVGERVERGEHFRGTPHTVAGPAGRLDEDSRLVERVEVAVSVGGLDAQLLRQ